MKNIPFLLQAFGLALFFSLIAALPMSLLFSGKSFGPHGIFPGWLMPIALAVPIGWLAGVLTAIIQLFLQKQKILIVNIVSASITLLSSLILYIL